MNLLSKTSLAGCVLACTLSPGTALAQFALPVATGSQTGVAGQGEVPSREAAAGQIALPAAEPRPYQPDVIDGAPSDAADLPGGAGTLATERAVPAAAAPPRASEYEQYVSALVGKPLRRFGAELLVPEARDFTAPPTTTVPADYRLNPGDQLQIGLAGSVQASNLRLTIDSEGRVFVPRVGAVVVGGVRYGDLHAVLSREISRQYREFTLEVGVARRHGITVYVTGFARRPGSYTLSGLSTLVNGVLAAGGPAPGGSFRSLQLRRGGRLVSDFDLYDLLLKGDKSGDAALQNGDVIYVAPAGEQVAVTGSVNNEAIFEVAPGETLQDAILYAGGVNTVADGGRIMVLDALGADPAAWQQVPAEEVQSRRVRRGDVLRVLSNVGLARPVQQQSVLVTISGEVSRPGRYFLAPGTRLSEVLARAGGLTAEAFPYAGVITRESVKRQQQQSFERAVQDMEFLLTAQPATSVNRAQLVQAGNVELVRSIVRQMRQREPSGRLVFDLPVTATTLPGDLILENNDSIHVPPRPVSVGVFGAVPTPASFAYRGGATVRDYVALAGGVQKLGDRGEIFVVRANGTVVSRGALGKPALPGDLVFVPIDADRGEFWARLRDITGTLFGGVVAAASVKALSE
jgi:protein involved in polysaccharide export with SLBB domain